MIESLLARQLVTDARRPEWAATLRESVYRHPKALAFCQSPARKKLVCANRRAGKTENYGLWSAARCVESTGWRVWVFAGDLAEYSRNWLDRRPAGLLAKLAEIGMREGTDYQVKRSSAGVRGIEFPRWGSGIEVFSAKDSAQIQKALGGRLNELVLDEAQKLRYIGEILTKVVGPASADFAALLTMTGTPSHEIDGLFYRAATGALSGWERHVFYSWDNPGFGDTWPARYKRAVSDTVTELSAEYGVTTEQLAWIQGATYEQATGIETDPIGKELPEDVQREYFGQWIENRTGAVFAFHAAHHWATFADALDSRHKGVTGPALLHKEPQSWPGRLAQLPTAGPDFGNRPKQWRAIIGADLGFSPDPFAIVALVYSRDDPHLYELASGKAFELGEDVQRDVLTEWVKGLQAQGVAVDMIVIDASGAGASVRDSWHRVMQPRFRVPVTAAVKHGKDDQIFAMNMDLRSGRFRPLESSPLAVEGRHLQWTPDARGGRKIDKNRKVYFPDGSEAVTADHCLDAARYAWRQWWIGTGRNPVKPEPLTPAEQFERRMEREAFAPTRPARRQHARRR